LKLILTFKQNRKAHPLPKRLLNPTLHHRAETTLKTRKWYIFSKNLFFQPTSCNNYSHKQTTLSRKSWRKTETRNSYKTTKI